MRLLIQTVPKDIHAICVAIAMHRIGHEAILLAALEQPSNQHLTVELSDDAGSWKLDASLELGLDDIDVIWWRRFKAPKPAEFIHRDDLKFTLGENRHFFRGLLQAASGKTVWVHSPGISETAESKIRQLAEARRVGLAIPRTMFSNSPEDIRAFITEIESEGNAAIYKTFGQATWVHGTGGKTMFARQVRPSDVKLDSVIQAVPGIYQEAITKSFEVRANFFGDREVAVRIDSQSDKSACQDWRASLNLGQILSPIKLPENVSAQCRELMARFSLSMACFDFIVTDSNEYVFLELNQQGQFLWIEELCPEIPVLHEFTGYMEDIAGTAAKPRSAGVSVPGFHDVFGSNEFLQAERGLESNGYFRFASNDA